jgi:hypothetical protein
MTPLAPAMKTRTARQPSHSRYRDSHDTGAQAGDAVCSAAWSM